MSETEEMTYGRALLIICSHPYSAEYNEAKAYMRAYNHGSRDMMKTCAAEIVENPRPGDYVLAPGVQGTRVENVIPDSAGDIHVLLKELPTEEFTTDEFDYEMSLVAMKESGAMFVRVPVIPARDS